MEKSTISRKHQKIARESFDCCDSNHTGHSKTDTNDHLVLHDNKKCVRERLKRSSSNAKSSASNKDHKPCKCLHCKATFKRQLSLDDHVVKTHPEFISQITRRIHECTICAYKTTFKHNFDRHVSQHPESITDSLNKSFTKKNLRVVISKKTNLHTVFWNMVTSAILDKIMLKYNIYK
nr:unnamed protein product [Callosobruchus analis]